MEYPFTLGSVPEALPALAAGTEAAEN